MEGSSSKKHPPKKEGKQYRLLLAKLRVYLYKNIRIMKCHCKINKFKGTLW